IEDAKRGLIEKIEVDGRSVEVTYVQEANEAEPKVFASRVGENSNLEQILRDEGVALQRPAGAGAGTAAVNLEYVDSSGFGPWLGLLLNILPFLLFGLFLLLIMRSAQGSN